MGRTDALQRFPTLRMSSVVSSPGLQRHCGKYVPRFALRPKNIWTRVFGRMSMLKKASLVIQSWQWQCPCWPRRCPRMSKPRHVCVVWLAQNTSFHGIDAVGVNCECRQSAIELLWAIQVCGLIVPFLVRPMVRRFLRVKCRMEKWQ